MISQQVRDGVAFDEAQHSLIAFFECWQVPDVLTRNSPGETPCRAIRHAHPSAAPQSPTGGGACRAETAGHGPPCIGQGHLPLHHPRKPSRPAAAAVARAARPLTFLGCPSRVNPCDPWVAPARSAAFFIFGLKKSLSDPRIGCSASKAVPFGRAPPIAGPVDQVSPRATGARETSA
jgi:hypothetical protein